jgi:hypothetical protein
LLLSGTGVTELDDAGRRKTLDDEAKRLVIDCTYSGRGHQEASATWSTVNAWLGLPIVVLSAVLASGAGLSAITGGDNRLTAALALMAAVLTATRGFFRPDELSEEHGLKGTRYIGLRNETRLFREVEMHGDWNFTDLALRLRELRDRYNALSETPPRRIPRWAYERAKESIARGESSYENDPLWKELGT